MTTLWIVIATVSLANFAIKAAGPVLVGGRDLPARATGVIDLLAPALLAALVVVDTFSEGSEYRLEADVVGVAAAGIAATLRAPILVVVAVAALWTALARALW